MYLVNVTLAGFIRVREKSGKNDFFKVRELSGNSGKCQGILEIFKNVMDLSGNFLIWLSASSFFFFQRLGLSLHF